MHKFISAFLLSASVMTGAAQAKEYNQWQLLPAAKAKATEADAAGKTAAAKPRKKRAERIRLVNVKDKNHRLALSCGVNSGRLQISALSGGKAQSAQTVPEDKGANRAKSQKTTLSLMIDGQSVLQDSPASQKITARGFTAGRATVRGDAMTQFISRFLAAKHSIAVSFGKDAAESFSAAQAAQAGLALQNCLHK